MDAEDHDPVEEEGVGELLSTLLSDVTNLQLSASFKMILFDKYTPIAVRKHKHH